MSTTNIRKLQLVTGQTVIGKVHEQTDTYVTLDHPLGISVVQVAQDQFGLRLVPFDPSEPEGLTRFYNSAIVSELLAIPDGLIKSYLEQTSSIQIISALDQMEGLRK